MITTDDDGHLKLEIHRTSSEAVEAMNRELERRLGEMKHQPPAERTPSRPLLGPPAMHKRRARV